MILKEPFQRRHVHLLTLLLWVWVHEVTPESTQRHSCEFTYPFSE